MLQHLLESVRSPHVHDHSAGVLDGAKLNPTPFDIWVIDRIFGFLGRHPLFDHCMQRGLRNTWLVGSWYALALFVPWMRAVRAGDGKVRQRIQTILIATLLAALLTVLAGQVVSWLPPSRHPNWAGRYPQYFDENININSFPSQSMTVYSVIAAGIYSLHRRAGWFLWALTVFFVGLPRIYVGGHYPSDVLAGLFLGLTSYAVSSLWFEKRVVVRLDQKIEADVRARMMRDAMLFVWIWQVAAGFRQVTWVRDAIPQLLGALK